MSKAYSPVRAPDSGLLDARLLDHVPYYSNMLSAFTGELIRCLVHGSLLSTASLVAAGTGPSYPSCVGYDAPPACFKATLPFVSICPCELSSMPAKQGKGEGVRKGVSRRLVLTAGALLERQPATYEVAERRHLAALAAVVRFAAEPTWLGLEWIDGAMATMYILPGRDALLAALLDAAQVGRAVRHVSIA